MRQLIHFEWAIKYLLHTPDKFIVFEGFLSALLREEIQVVRLLECNQQAETTASNRIDLLVATGKGDLLVVASFIVVICTDSHPPGLARAATGSRALPPRNRSGAALAAPAASAADGVAVVARISNPCWSTR